VWRSRWHVIAGTGARLSCSAIKETKETIVNEIETRNGSVLSRRTAVIGAAVAGIAALPVAGALAQTSTSEEGAGTPGAQTSSVMEDPGTPVADASPVADGPVVFPDSEIGNNLKSWIDAINSGDPDVMLAHYEKYPAPPPPEVAAGGDLLSSRRWGQLIVHSLESPSETKLLAYLEATRSEEWLEVTLEVDGERMAFGAEGARPPADRLPVKGLSDEELNAEMTRYLKKLSDADVFSGSVLIARKGKVVFEGGYGIANAELDEANDVTTRFNLGSMNKMVTAVAIGQLFEGGKLAFADTIATHLPDYPSDVAQQITIEQLLTHTSGLGDFFGPKYEAARETLFDLSDYLPLFADAPLMFTPGDRFEYSNAGFIVLGLIVEAVSGQSYFDYVLEHIFSPIGMASSDSYEVGADVPHLAIGYTYPQSPDGGLTLAVVTAPRVTNDDFLSPRGTSAGGGYSTVEDLLKFERALHGSDLLKPETVDLLISGKVDSGPQDEQYGYGFVVKRNGDHHVVGHDGGAPGISALLDMYWESGTVLVSLSNYENIAPLIGAKANQFLRFD
jgi:CubicO group peptidase (beta-lactamase class C family)